VCLLVGSIFLMLGSPFKYNLLSEEEDSTNKRSYNRNIVALFSAFVLTYIMGLGFSINSSPKSGGSPRRIAKRLVTSLGGMSAEEAYVAYRKTPALFENLMQKEWLAPGVDDVVAAAKRGEVHPIIKKEAEGIYSFDLFTEKFCRALLDEVDNYFDTGLPVRRPNSMNNYGLIVNEIGMRPAITKFQQEVLLPIAKLLFPNIGYSFHNHHSFMVQYRATEDPNLDLHTDDSDVTVNICLGEEFTGSGLTFCGYVGAADHRHFNYSYQHKKGRAVIHLGTRRHGADDIHTGTRRNLIIWNHNSKYRASKAYSLRMYDYQKEAGPPDPVCLSYTHDRDYSFYKEYKETNNGNQADFAKRAWCPPPSAKYDEYDATLAKIRKEYLEKEKFSSPSSD